MASDSLGYLYVNTNNGLYRYEQSSNRLEKIFDAVSHVRIDGNNNVWVRYQNKWGILDTNTSTLNTPKYDKKYQIMAIPLLSA